MRFTLIYFYFVCIVQGKYILRRTFWKHDFNDDSELFKDHFAVWSVEGRCVWKWNSQRLHSRDAALNSGLSFLSAAVGSTIIYRIASTFDYLSNKVNIWDLGDLGSIDSIRVELPPRREVILHGVHEWFTPRCRRVNGGMRFTSPFRLGEDTNSLRLWSGEGSLVCTLTLPKRLQPFYCVCGSTNTIERLKSLWKCQCTYQ